MDKPPAPNQNTLYGIVGLIVGILLGIVISGYSVNSGRYTMMGYLGMGRSATMMQQFLGPDVQPNQWTSGMMDQDDINAMMNRIK